MKLFYFLLLLLMALPEVKAQNLVLNPDLEDYSLCPERYGAIDSARHWHTSTNNPDYFNRCANATDADQGVPGGLGYQEAANGDGYLGLLAYGSFANHLIADNREFATGTLSSPLKPGTTYYATFKASLMNESSHAINNLGLKFYTAAHTNIAPSNSPQVFTKQVVRDTVGWVTISGSFVADSAYTHFTVGNHYEDDSTQIDSFQAITRGHNAYYVLDDFCVATDKGTCLTSVSTAETKESTFSVFPNPTTGHFTISNPSQEVLEIVLFDLMGKMVLQRSFAENSQFDISHLPAGIYAYTLVRGSESVKTGKIVKE